MNLLTTVMICSMFHDNATVNAIIETGSKNKPLMVTTVADADHPAVQKDFKLLADASSYAKKQLAAGSHIEIGLMQIPSGWLKPLAKQGVTLDDLFLPCKNVVVGSDLLNQAETYCATQTDSPAERDQCALSFYKTGSTSKGLTYATTVLNYASGHPIQALPENPETPVNYKSYMPAAEYDLPEPNFSDKPSTQEA